MTRSNFQNLVVVVDEAEFGLGRDELLAVLRAENVLARRDFHASIEREGPFSIKAAVGDGQLQRTTMASRDTYQLPIGGGVSLSDIDLICEIVTQAQTNARVIRLAGIAPTSAK